MSVLIICLTCGIIIGYTYDFFRAVRITSKYNKFFTLISDLFFWLITGAITILTFFYIDGLNLRFYRFLAIIIGAMLYFIFFSSLFLKISEKILKVFAYFLKILFTILNFCVKILNIIWNSLLYPFKILCKLIVINLKKLGGQFHKLKKISKRV